ncbi:MAG TPA: hypothetical protein VK875_05795 [Euzebyales bacterium]|nr:hypothetical protein [Euzebyales bacterium]
MVTALLGLLFTGLTATTLALWANDATYSETNPVVDLAFFALGGILVTAGLASQIRVPRVAGLQQAVVALVVLSVAGGLGGRVEPFLGPLVLLAAAAPLVVLHPDRRQLLASGAGGSKPLAVLAAVAAVPAAVYAAGMLDRARTAGPSCFLGQCALGDRYAEAAALAVAVAVVALLAAARTEGWRLPAWSAGAAAALLGVASLFFPGQVGALSPVWSVAAVMWGLALVLVGEYQQRAPTRPQAHDDPSR